MPRRGGWFEATDGVRGGPVKEPISKVDERFSDRDAVATPWEVTAVLDYDGAWRRTSARDASRGSVVGGRTVRVLG